MTTNSRLKRYCRYYNSLWVCYLHLKFLLHSCLLFTVRGLVSSRCPFDKDGYFIACSWWSSEEWIFAQVLESSITSSCTILHSYRLCPISNAGISALVIGGYSVGFLGLCGLAGKSVAFLWPCGFKVGNPQVFRPQASCNWEPQFVADHINGPIAKSCRRTMEPCTTTKTTTIIVGQRLTIEQYQLETNSKLFVVLYLTTDINKQVHKKIWNFQLE